MQIPLKGAPPPTQLPHLSHSVEFCTFADVKVCAGHHRPDCQDPRHGGTCQVNTLFKMKINSIFGKMSGKIGNVVVANVNGQVVGREYNPNVTNPNTQSQQGTRGRFKLVSQLSATFAPVIAIKKDGAKSARNQFSAINFENVNYANGTADINLSGVQLTKSGQSFGGFKADRTGGKAIEVELNVSAAGSLSRVVYIAYTKNANGELQLLGSVISSTPGADGKFAASLPFTSGAVVLYAYGMKDLESSITTKFGNLMAPTAEDVAKLLVSSSDNMSGVSLTKTAGCQMAVGTNTANSNDAAQIAITATVDPAGVATITGAGSFNVGDTCTLEAPEIPGYTFDGWYENGSKVSSSATYSFTVQTPRTLVAKYF